MQYQLPPSMVEWSDAIITAGGDGTFLSAASKVKNQSKPVIGINTVPERSEGHLCLPPKYSNNFALALDKLANGEFSWLWRQRIRVTMSGIPANFRPINNTEMLRIRMQRMTKPHNTANEENHLYDALHYEQDLNDMVPQSNVLPVLALNEVFIGETLASVPSYYEIQIDSDASEKQKSSGVCIATGTGSTAWSYNICRLHSDAIGNILNIAKNTALHETRPDNGIKSSKKSQMKDDVITKVTEEFSNSHIFGPSEDRLLFSVRDPMENRVFSCRKYNGFAKQITVRSRCWDASLCVDGDTSFAFNDGASAKLSIHPEDALRCVIVHDDDNNNLSR